MNYNASSLYIVRGNFSKPIYTLNDVTEPWRKAWVRHWWFLLLNVNEMCLLDLSHNWRDGAELCIYKIDHADICLSYWINHIFQTLIDVLEYKIIRDLH